MKIDADGCLHEPFNQSGNSYTRAVTVDPFEGSATQSVVFDSLDEDLRNDGS